MDLSGELIVGVNTYVTVEEADAYVSTYYFSTDLIRTQWESLPSTDKEVLLARSLIFMETLPFAGAKASTSQELCFPRRGMTTVPEKVKRAQIVEALSDFDPEVIKYRAMRSNGVQSFTIGGLTEMFFKSSMPGDSVSMLSPTARILLKEYLSGGYAIC